MRDDLRSKRDGDGQTTTSFRWEGGDVEGKREGGEGDEGGQGRKEGTEGLALPISLKLDASLARARTQSVIGASPSRPSHRDGWVPFSGRARDSS